MLESKGASSRCAVMLQAILKGMNNMHRKQVFVLIVYFIKSVEKM